MVKLFMILFLSLAVAFAEVRGADPAVSVTSEIYPSRARVGESVRYRISIEIINDPGTRLGQETPNATLPRVSGLDLQYIGISTRTQTSFSTSGSPSRTATLTLNYTALARGPGTYLIPGFELIFRGAIYAVPASKVIFYDHDDPDETNHPPLFHLELLLPEEKVYVGQTVKASLQLYALDRIPSLRNSHPVKIGDAFAEGKLADSQTRSRALRDEHHYDVLSRPLTLTPIMSGQRNLSYEMEVQALLPVNGSLFDPSPTGQSGGNSLFNDPFFQQFQLRSDPRMEYQNVTVASQHLQIEVHPLPAEERPAVFSGAIGAFTMRAFPSTNSVRLGDPLKLRIQLAGQGNFDRVIAPEIDLGPQWKSYSHGASFRPGDSLGFSGVKSFDYTLIPLDTGVDRLPEISIAYFDPRSERYEVLTTGEIPLTVLDNPDFQSGDQGTFTGSDARVQLPKQVFALRTHPGNLAAPTESLLQNRIFLTAQLLPLSAILLLTLFRWRQRKFQQDFIRQRRHQARRRLNELQAGLHDVMRNLDGRAFHARLLHGIRIVLAIRHGDSAEAATRDELESMLEQCQLQLEDHTSLSNLIHDAERIAFSGTSTPAADLIEIRLRWETLLDRLEKTVSQ